MADKFILTAARIRHETVDALRDFLLTEEQRIAFPLRSTFMVLRMFGRSRGTRPRLLGQFREIIPSTLHISNGLAVLKCMIEGADGRVAIRPLVIGKTADASWRMATAVLSSPAIAEIAEGEFKFAGRVALQTVNRRTGEYTWVTE